VIPWHTIYTKFYFYVYNRKMPTAYQLKQKAEEDELLNITAYVRRAEAKGKARREALERGEILNEPPVQINPFRTTMANRLREQGLTSAALPPTHPVHTPKIKMANMLLKQGRTATRNAIAAKAAANMLVKQERMAAMAAAAAKAAAAPRSKRVVIGGTRRRSRKQRNSRKRTTRKAY
jgi:hypothetical protein